MGKTSIEWTAGPDGMPGKTWNPTRGCSRVSEGCRNCYAERIAARFSTHAYQTGDDDAGVFAGFAKQTAAGPRWTGRVELIPSKLGEPLRWRKPCRCFVNSMSDLFHEALPFEHIAAVFGVMAMCPHITFQVLTKRPERARAFFAWVREKARIATSAIAVVASAADEALPDTEAIDRLLLRGDYGRKATWPLPNVWLGTSCEDQATAEKRIPYLFDCPAAVRFVSYEPALGPVDFTRLEMLKPDPPYGPGAWLNALTGHLVGPDDILPDHLDQIIVGGESGPSARPFDTWWARSVIEQCSAAGVACFVKQMGSKPTGWSCASGPDCTHPDCGRQEWHLRDRKGGDMSEWPERYRVRQFPEVRHAP
jgi:protein gp37